MSNLLCDKPAEKRDLGAACNLIQWILTSSSLLGQKYDQQRRLIIIDCKESFSFGQFYLVCDSAWLRSTSKTLYFFGRLLGAVVFGQLSDM